MTNTRCEQLIHDAFTVFDDLERTDQDYDLIDWWICRAQEDVRKVDWVRDVIPTIRVKRWNVESSLYRLRSLEEAVDRETTVSRGPSQYSSARQKWLKKAECRHQKLLNRLLKANEQYLEACACQGIEPKI